MIELVVFDEQLDPLLSHLNGFNCVRGIKDVMTQKLSYDDEDFLLSDSTMLCATDTSARCHREIDDAK